MLFRVWSGANGQVSTDFFIFAVLLQINSLLAIAMLLAARSLGQPRVATLLAAAFGANVLLYAANAIQFFYYRDDVWIGLGVAMIAMVPPTFAVSAYRLRAGLPSWRTFFITSHVTATLLFFLFSVVTPHAGLHGAIVPLYSAMILMLGITSMWRPGRPLQLGERPIIFSTCALTAAAAAGGIVLALGGDGRSAGTDETYVVILFLGMPAMTVAAGIFSLYLLAGDLAERLRIAADTDALTGAPNRRAIEATGMRMINEARAGRRPLSVALCDIDNFKDINDLHGHGLGDEVLCRLTTLFRQDTPAHDHFGRYGGEEFVIFLPGDDLDSARDRVERLRNRIMNLRFEAIPEPLTASFGVATLSAADRILADVLERADAALYVSKQAGRNRTTIDRQSEATE